MARNVRAVVGGVVVFVLLLVAGVAGLVAAVAAGQAREDTWTAVEEPTGAVVRDPVETGAEVLDVDVEPVEGERVWAGADVLLETADGTTEVAYVDLGERDVDELPEPGDTLDVVYERDDPRAVFRADDPLLAEQPPGPVDDGPPEWFLQQQALAEATATRMAGLAVGALVAAVVVALVTLLAVRRAPEPEPARWEQHLQA